MKVTVNEIEIECTNFDPSISEIKSYLKFIDEDIDKVILTKTINGVDLDYHIKGKPFERIRRVTGYLSPLKRFNDSKRSEESERIKHRVCD